MRYELPSSQNPAEKGFRGLVTSQKSRVRINIAAISALLLLLGLCYVRVVLRYVQSSPPLIHYASGGTNGGSISGSVGLHPISRLIHSAKAEYEELNRNAIMSVGQAAKAYRAKRGRHPPPDFDKWVHFALSKRSSVNEMFFDQIYEDLEPFWGKNPSELRVFSTMWHNSISIRGGKPVFRIGPERNSTYFHYGWIAPWLTALRDIPFMLPDVDMALNDFDEARVFVPWEEMAYHMHIAKQNRHTRNPKDMSIIDTYSTYPTEPKPPPQEFYKWTQEESKWHRTRRACPPDSPVRNREVHDIGIPHFVPTKETYMRNLTFSKYVCDQPDLFNFHSAFIRPDVPVTTKTLYPIFSASKIAGVSNDILLPPAMYMQPENAQFTGGSAELRRVPWKDKHHKAFWRGSNSGGNMDQDTWRYFQRPRLISMMNGSQVEAQERIVAEHPEPEWPYFGDKVAFNFPWPHDSLAALKSSPTTLGAWVNSTAEAGMRNPENCQMWTICYWLTPFFRQVENMAMRHMFEYKYLPDVDGFAYSGRYNSFLDSTSLPIKATVYTEWHHSRLVPWYHFVPMDNTMRDWWGIMEYFAGYNATEFDADESLHREAHDEEAETIALQGMEWHNRHLRIEDMTVYMYRLVLEYARICDDNRERMGYVGDLQ
ncbi:hypothetical protein ANO11243_018470 [Dothideomycetidae sp. 11243]|nr:hypothetical protein ANO11243_018470 [fungal sp. No.11243]